MTRYHVKSNGEMGICQARIKCPFLKIDSETRHFNSKEEASEYSQKIFEESYGVFPGSSKKESIESRREAKLKEIAQERVDYNKKIFPAYRSENELNSFEKQIVDKNLEYVNSNRVEKGGKTYYPYKTLINYSPNMKGNNGIWLSTEIKVDYRDNSIYVVNTISDTVRSLGRTRDSSIFRIRKFANDLDGAAIEYAQVSIDNALREFKNHHKNGKKAVFIESPLYEDDPSQPRNYERNIIFNRREEIKNRLNEALKESEVWRANHKEKTFLEMSDEMRAEGLI